MSTNELLDPDDFLPPYGLRGLGEADWRRTGRHPEWGRISVIQQLSYLARHEQSHWPDLERRP